MIKTHPKRKEVHTELICKYKIKHNYALLIIRYKAIDNDNIGNNDKTLNK